MQIGMVGLGRMGAAMVRRLMRAGHECVVFDRNPEVVSELEAEGASGVADLSELVARLGSWSLQLLWAVSSRCWAMNWRQVISSSTAEIPITRMTLPALHSLNPRAFTIWMSAPVVVYSVWSVGARTTSYPGVFSTGAWPGRDTTHHGSTG